MPTTATVSINEAGIVSGLDRLTSAQLGALHRAMNACVDALTETVAVRGRAIADAEADVLGDYNLHNGG